MKVLNALFFIIVGATLAILAFVGAGTKLDSSFHNIGDQIFYYGIMVFGLLAGTGVVITQLLKLRRIFT